MNFALYVTAAPSQQSHYCALQFAEAIAASEHQLWRVFFSGDATYVANQLCVNPQNEVDMGERWRQLATTASTELILCVAASLKRGLLDASEAQRYEKPAQIIELPFQIAGLGLLVEAFNNADRLITFK